MASDETENLKPDNDEDKPDDSFDETPVFCQILESVNSARSTIAFGDGVVTLVLSTHLVLPDVFSISQHIANTGPIL